MVLQLYRAIKRMRVFLRQSDSRLFDPITRQRNDVYFDKCNGKPSKEIPQDKFSLKFQVKNISVRHKKSGQDDTYTVEWKDGHKSVFDADWIKVQMNRLESPSSGKVGELSPIIPRIPWGNLTEDEVRCSTNNNRMTIPFREIIHQPKMMEEAIRILYKYGILVVTSTPINDDGAGIAALASALSGPARKSETTLLTHYTEIDKKTDSPRKAILENGTDGPQKTMFGNIWSTHSSQMAVGTSTADTAYGTEALPLHTDCGYYRDPPGLQIFTMCNPAESGGESVFSDGLALAEYMRNHHKREFDTLCRTVRRYRSIDKEMGWHLEGSGPIIKAVDRFEGYSSTCSTTNHHARWGAVLGIRHNDLDRLPDLPPQNIIDDEKSVNDFYDDLAQAHKVWDMLLGKDEFRLVMKVKSGETVVVANQRCLHGRYSFNSTSTPRVVMGCYVSQDDLESRYRWMLNGCGIFQ